jgi:hypothetical protein
MNVAAGPPLMPVEMVELEVDANFPSVLPAGTIRSVLPAAGSPPPFNVLAAPVEEIQRRIGRIDAVENHWLQRLEREPLPPDCPPEATQLGEPIGSLSMPRSVVPFIAAPACFLAALIFLFLALVTARGVAIGNALFLSGLFLAVAVRFGWLALTTVPAHCWACRLGLVWQRGNDFECCRWEEIPSVREDEFWFSYIGPLLRLWHLGDVDADKVKYNGQVTMPSGKVLYLRPRYAKQARAFGHIIARRVAKAKFPASLQQLYAGHPVEFGPLKMDAQGLTSRSGTLAWTDVGRIRFFHGTLIVEDRSKRSVMSEGTLPNALLAAALAEEWLRTRYSLSLVFEMTNLFRPEEVVPLWPLLA